MAAAQRDRACDPPAPWLRGVRAATAALLVVAAVAFAGELPATGASGPVCGYPTGVTPNRWSPLPGPPGLALGSVGQFDQSPCQLIGVGSAGLGPTRVVRSTDAGRHWVADGSAPVLSDLVTERLTKGARGRWFGPLLATGPVTVPVTGVLPRVSVDSAQQVYASTDGGRSFVPSVLGSGSTTAPLRGHLLSGATALRYANGSPQPVVYAIAAVAHAAAAGPAPAVSGDRELLSSTDGGRSFLPVGTGGALAPTVLDVNPANQDEIWVNSVGAGAGGAWKSTDGGTTWTPACCAAASVQDIAFGPGLNGTTAVYLASNQGVLTSSDDGSSWASVTDTAVEQVRTVPDAPGVLVAVTADHHVLAWLKPGRPPISTPGLPADCTPSQLRRDAVVPPTFLVTCATGATYRMLLDGYGAGGASGSGQPGGPGLPGLPTAPPSELTALPLTPLATWKLPLANTESGAVAFDGTYIYYDDFGHEVRRIRATDGANSGHIHVPSYISPSGLTVDLKRDRLLIAGADGGLYGFGIATHRITRLADSPYAVPTFDASIDGLSWVPTQSTVLEQTTVTGGPWNVHTVCTDIPRYGTTSTEPSTFVASGDGGGYVQSEDDSTLYRIDAHCHLVGPLYQHRTYSEAGGENDAMACDTQTFFPQAAIWIRDSAPQTVTAYEVPYGYCPMPSRLVVSAPRTVAPGSTTDLCTILTNATTGLPVAGRGVSLSVRGMPLGNARTAADGRACFPYVAPGVAGGKRLPLRAESAFAGDPSLYPSRGAAMLAVVAGLPTVIPPALPHPPPPLLRALVPPPPPPPNPPPNAPNVPAQAPGPATNVSQAQQGQAQAQSQPGTQGVVVAQQERQPQLALATVANQLETNVAGQNAMTAPATPQRSGWPSGLLLGAGAAGCALAMAFGRGVVALNPIGRRQRPAGPRSYR